MLSGLMRTDTISVLMVGGWLASILSYGLFGLAAFRLAGRTIHMPSRRATTIG